MAREYPKQLFHRTEAPVIVNNKDEEAALGQGWQTKYILQEYPKILFHQTKKDLVVKTKEEQDAALTRGYQTAGIAKAALDDPGRRVDPLEMTASTMSPEMVQHIQEMEFEITRLRNGHEARAQALEDKIAVLEEKVALFDSVLIGDQGPEKRRRSA
jgi:hypothetical protein